MDVAYVLCQDDGGLPHYTAELANAVSKHANVSVIKPTTTTADEFFNSAVELYEVLDPVDISIPKIVAEEVDVVRILKALRSYHEIDRVREIDPDVVHFTVSSELFPYLKYFVRRTEIDTDYPFVETIHNLEPKKRVLRTEDLSVVDSNNPYTWLAISNLRNVLNWVLPAPNRDHVVVHTEEERRRLLDRGLSPERISIVPHGVFEIFRNGTDDVPTEDNHVLFFGRITSRKGPDTLVKAVPYLRERIPDIKVTLAGEGKLQPEPREIIEAYPDHFELYNEFIPNERVGELYARSKIVVLPQRKLVGQSGTLTIAFSFQKPVVTSSVGSFPELVCDSGSGLVVPPDDPKILANAMATILQNENLWRAMAENTGAIREQLSWENVADRHYSIYEGIVRSDERGRTEPIHQLDGQP